MEEVTKEPTALDFLQRGTAGPSGLVFLDVVPTKADPRKVRVMHLRELLAGLRSLLSPVAPGEVHVDSE
jgi:hypothetical protein